ncbi:hypothetical protein [Klebsiella pneumoniae IS10]|nr:hypothetical protein [Klebsiella pneumoniae IS10]
MTSSLWMVESWARTFFSSSPDNPSTCKRTFAALATPLTSKRLVTHNWRIFSTFSPEYPCFLYRKHWRRSTA